MIALSYGYQLPEQDDPGSQFFPAMEANIQQLNDHNHDGANSARLQTVKQNLSSDDWVAAASGEADLYEQTVTMPTGLLYNNVEIGFRNDSGDVVYLTTLALSTTTFIVQCNDPSMNPTVVYSS